MLKLKKFIFSNKNMVGMGFAMITILLALTGILKAFWMVIMVMSYAFGYFVGPKEKEIKFYHVKGESLIDYMGFVKKLESKVNESEKMPSEAKMIMKQISLTAVELLDFMKENTTAYTFNEEMVNFKNVFDTYLPKLINQYDKLPKEYVLSAKDNQGRTPKDLLIEQLTLLNQKIKEIAYGMYENDFTSLKVNGRFLRDKFEDYSFAQVGKNSK